MARQGTGAAADAGGKIDDHAPLVLGELLIGVERGEVGFRVVTLGLRGELRQGEGPRQIAPPHAVMALGDGEFHVSPGFG